MNKRIYIADENPNFAETISYALELEGFDVYARNEGEGLVQDVLETRPDLLLLGTTTPNIAAFSACNRLKKRINGNLVVVMVGNGHNAERDGSRRAGADHYLAKPLNPAKVVEEVGLLLA